MNARYSETCQRYLSGRMSQAEIDTFEQALRDQPAFQKAYIDFMLSEQANPYYAEERLRDIARVVREDTGPMPNPPLSVFDRLWLFWVHKPLIAIALFSLLMLGFIFAGKSIWDHPDLSSIQEHMIDPFCLSVAGSAPAPVDNEKVSKLASDFYCGVANGGRDSIAGLAAACGGFCMAHYYLAHWDLRAGDYASARVGLEACLQNQNIIQQESYNRSIGKLKLNLLLAELGESPNRLHALHQRLDDMVKNDPDFQNQLNEEAREKAHELLILLQR